MNLVRRIVVGLVVVAAFVGTDLRAVCTLTPTSGVIAARVPFTLPIVPAGGAAPYVLKIDSRSEVNTWLTLKEDKGAFSLSGTPPDAGPFQFDILMSDDKGTCRDLAIAFTLGCPISVGPAAFPDATVGVPYPAEKFTFSGGTAPYNAVLVDPKPLGGMFIEANTLQGTPTNAGKPLVFQVDTTDKTGCTVRTTHQINAFCPNITTLPALMPRGAAGISYSTTLGASGGTAGYTFAIASGNLPSGLTLSNGVISGTPTTQGDSNFTIRTTDKNGCTDLRAYTINICPAITVSPAALSDATVGQAFSATFTASGGSPVYTYSSSGSLPPGLTLNSNGLLSGTPAASGIFSFDIIAKDLGNCEGRTGYSIRVCPALSIAAMKDGALGQSYREPLVGSGGDLPYTFKLGKDPLPPGLSFDGVSTISGTPAQVGKFTFAVEVQDKSGCASVRDVTISVTEAPCPPIVVTPATVPNATVGSTYSVTFGGKGTADPVTVTFSGETPPGLSFKTDTLGGTPTTPGKYDFSILIRDTNGCSKSQTYTLFVEQESCPALTISPAALPNGAVGTSYPASLMIGGGGTNPHTISLHAGSSLPTGLSLISNQISGTPTTAGTFRFELDVKDGKGCSGTVAYSITIAPAADPCPTGGATLVSPTSGEKFDGTKPVAFSWSDVKGATSYDLLLSDDGINFSTAVSTTSTGAFLTLKGGSFSWFIRTQFGPDCKPVNSNVSRFTIEPPVNCPTGVARLLTPLNGVTISENPVIFSWDKVEGAIKYVLRASVNGGAFNTLDTTSETAVKIVVPDGQIAWLVETVFESCPSTQSQTSRFTFGKVSNCPTTPGSAKIIAPADGSREVASPVLFQWSAVLGASGYRVMASLSDGPYVALGTTTATQLSATVPAGPVNWYVETLFGDCASTVSDKSSFTAAGGAQCNNSATTLISPANGASNVSSPVKFSWSEVKGAVSYRLFVSLNGGKLELAATTDLTSVTQFITEGSTVEWIVESIFLACPAIKSNAFRFSVAAGEKCATSISTTSPASGASVTSPVTLRWTPAAGATVYRVWAGIDGGAPSPIAKSTTPEVVVQIPNGVVEWYVEVIFEKCPAILSDPAKFEVQKSSDCTRNTAPSLVSPLGQASGPAPVSSPVEFRWLASPNAVAYRLWVAGEKQPFGDLGFTKETSVKVELPPGIYAWYVDAIFEGCPAVPSERSSFSIVSSFARCGGESPSLISPANGATNVSSPVTFLWSSVPGAKEYRVFASVDGSTVSQIASTTATSFTQPVPPGVITWSVEAVFDACPSTESNKAQFTIREASNCSTARPVTQSPADGSQNVGQLVNFAWSPISGAIKYALIVSRNDGSPTLAGQTDDTDFEVRLSDGKYEWHVLALTGNCDPVESNHATFTIPAPPCDARPPVLKAPSNGASALASPVGFEWTPVSGATSYKLWVVGSDGVPSLVATTTETATFISLPGGVFEWYVVATFDNCPAAESARSRFSVATAPPPCQSPAKPRVDVVGQALSGTIYSVRWSPVPNATVYELQEATNPDFSDSVTFVRTDLSAPFVHEVSGQPQQYLYRARAISSCNDLRSQYSDVIGVFIVPLNASDIQKKGSAEVGVLESLIQTVFIPGFAAPVQFTAATDRPWMTVTPSSGILPPEGMTLTLTADPATLYPGSNTATLLMSYGTGGKGVKSNAAPPPSLPISVSLVTPVGQGGKNTPPPDALIIPAVAHTIGANNSVFESDVRVYNATTRPMTYQLNFTPAGVDGTQTGKSTTIQVEAGATTALDDVLATFFGATTSSNTAGMLEIRALTSSSSSSSLIGSSSKALSTIASSRTYNITPNGTFGQYVPAVKFSDFVGKAASGPNPILSLQQVAQSAAYRTNFGLVEGSGQPATLTLRIFSAAGDLLAEIPETLGPAEFKRLDSLLGRNGITADDARVEIEVTSATGKVTAYASRLDNRTNDPLLISPVVKSSVSSTRYVIPGVAYLDGLAKWRTDVRVFNSSSTPVDATVTFFPEANPQNAQSVQVRLNGNEVRALDNVLNSTFGINAPRATGSILVSTQSASGIIATARTYAETDNGTYGLFTPAVTPIESVGKNERSLHLLQLESSAKFRTNVGLLEASGQDAVVEISLTVPDSRVSPKVTYPLKGNTFLQFPISNFGVAGSIYNARVSVKVISGNGRVTAYGALVDNATQDPTYIPAQ